ncbi:MAG: hypothetical protein WDN69_05275 [Aliidongia sp.]
MQIGVGQIFEQVVHRRIFPTPVAKGDELIIEISGRLSGEPREIVVIRALALRTVARTAGQHTRRHCIGRMLVRGRRRGMARSLQEDRQDGEGPSQSLDRFDVPETLHRTASPRQWDAPRRREGPAGKNLASDTARQELDLAFITPPIDRNAIAAPGYSLSGCIYPDLSGFERVGSVATKGF